MLPWILFSLKKQYSFSNSNIYDNSFICSWPLIYETIQSRILYLSFPIIISFKVTFPSVFPTDLIKWSRRLETEFLTSSKHSAFSQSSCHAFCFSVRVLVSVPAPNMRTWRNNHPWNIALKPILLSTLLTVCSLENMIPLEVTHCPQNKFKLFSVRDKTHLCWFPPTRSVSCSHLCTKGILSF